MQNRMDLDPGVMKVNKLIRLGRRAVSEEGVIKSRPSDFQLSYLNTNGTYKRQTVCKLRTSGDSIFFICIFHT